jgi:hypothetical protein
MRRSIPLELTIEEAWTLFRSQNATCALSGLPIGFGIGTKTTASIDRIDSEGPYKLGNVQWVHKHINMMKGPLPQHRFLELCSTIHTFESEKRK